MTDPDLAALIIDDRSKRIEIIREKSDVSPTQSYTTAFTKQIKPFLKTPDSPPVE